MSTIHRLLDLMARLRDPQRGCPWDREQTFRTIAPYTIEEAYEVADAIERDDVQSLREELGDLLFQVVFHSQMAAERGEFTFGDVVDAICDKMERRHPHVFGGARIDSAAEQSIAWEEHKRRERARRSDSVLADVPISLPALTRANKLGKRAAQVGFEWPDVRGALDKLEEELRELRQAIAEGSAAASGGAAGSGDAASSGEAATSGATATSGGTAISGGAAASGEAAASGSTARSRVADAHIAAELGDVLFCVVNVCRYLQIDPETSLRATNAKFERRFRHVERRLNEQGRSVQQATLAEMDRLWDEAKALASAPQGAGKNT